MFPSDDCDEEITFTNIVKKLPTTNPAYDRTLEIWQFLSMEPSYEISNQVKIENVDFITYIFGAAGTWFGFCFLMMNPVILIDMFYQQKDKINTNENSIVGKDEEWKASAELKMKEISKLLIKYKAFEIKLNQMAAVIQKAEHSRIRARSASHGK